VRASRAFWPAQLGSRLNVRCVKKQDKVPFSMQVFRSGSGGCCGKLSGYHLDLLIAFTILRLVSSRQASVGPDQTEADPLAVATRGARIVISHSCPQRDSQPTSCLLTVRSWGSAAWWQIDSPGLIPDDRTASDGCVGAGAKTSCRGAVSYRRARGKSCACLSEIGRTYRVSYHVQLSPIASN